MEIKERDREGRTHGDTYEQYTRRCRMAGLEAQSFNAWLLFELNLPHKPGPAQHLDAYHRQLVNA